MTIDQMRSAISVVYGGDRWRRKVGLMRDEQVIAVYKSMKSRDGRIKPKPGRKKMEPGIKRAVQLTIWDFAR